MKGKLWKWKYSEILIFWQNSLEFSSGLRIAFSHENTKRAGENSVLY